MSAGTEYPFEDIHHFIQKSCQLILGKIPSEDWIQEGWYGYLWAKKHYKQYEGYCDFWTFAFECIQHRIQSAKREWYSAAGWNTSSLDQPCAHCDCSLGNFIPARESFVTRFDLLDYIHSFDEDARKTAFLYIQKYEDNEIMDNIHITREGLEKTRARLRCYMLEYLESEK